MHYLHNDYPLAAKKFEINYHMLSHKYMFADKYGIKVVVVKTSVPNLCNKSKYVIYYRNLQLHLTFRMKLNKVHRILKLRQSD